MIRRIFSREFKVEAVRLIKDRAARADVFDYIERFYNPRRRHSTLGYVSPIDFEAKMRLA